MLTFISKKIQIENARENNGGINYSSGIKETSKQSQLCFLLASYEKICHRLFNAFQESLPLPIYSFRHPKKGSSPSLAITSLNMKMIEEDA